MPVLVTGGAGYIGSHMAHRLCDEGESVVILDNLSTGIRANAPHKAKLIEGDIGDQALAETLLRRYQIDAIIHFAGSIIVPESVAQPLDYYHNNTAKSRNLIESAVRCGVKNFIFSSTAAVYGMPDHNPVSESAPLKPISPYGASKMMTEQMLADSHHAYGLAYGILRYFNVAGADPQGRTGQSTPKATHLIKVACQTALKQRPHLQLFGTDYPTPDGTCIRDYIHVSDLVDAHWLTLHHLRRTHSPLLANCGYGQGFSVQDVIDAVKTISGVDFPVEKTGRRPGDPAELIADASHIKSVLPWSPRYNDLHTIVEHAWRWESRL
jgi:UDP-glucose 4-epimerase